MKILHLYRSYDGHGRAGIYYLLKKFLQIQDDRISNHLLVASQEKRKSKISEDLTTKQPKIFTTKSFGNFLSMPLSPNYIFKSIRMAKKYDAIVAHTPFPFANLAILFFGHNQKKFIFWHADIVKNRFLKILLNPIITLSLRKVDGIIVGHPMIIETSKTLLKFKHKCHTLTFPVNIAPFEQDNTEKNIDLIACGRLVKYKGYDILIEALQNIKSQLYIIGDGPEKASLLKKCDDLNLKDKINFLGEIDEKEKISYLKRSKIFILSSNTEQETFGIVQIEAMAARCAIINTKINTAVPHIATHECEALTAEPNNPKDLEEKISELLENNTLREKLGMNGYNKVRLLFNEKNFIREFKNILEK